MRDSFRRKIVIFRTVMLVSGAFFLAFALLSVLADLSEALEFALVGGGLLLLVARRRSSATAYPVHEWIGMGLVAGGLAAGGSVILAATLFPVAFLVLVAAALWNRRAFRRARSFGFEVGGATEVMPGAEAAVAAFEAEGFTRAGSYAVVMPPASTRVVGTVLVPPSADRYAVVTDRVAEVTSRFAGERWVLTVSSGKAPLPDDILRQLVAPGLPAELARAHETAIALLSARGVRPDRLEDGAVLEAALASEKRAVQFASETGWRQFLSMAPRGKRSEPVLGDDRRSRRRIEAWLASRA